MGGDSEVGVAKGSRLDDQSFNTVQGDVDAGVEVSEVFLSQHLAGASPFGVEKREKQHWRRSTMIKAIFRST